MEGKQSSHGPTSDPEPSVRTAARILHVTATLKGAKSRTLQLAQTFFTELRRMAPAIQVTTLDLYETPPPLDEATFRALRKRGDHMSLPPEDHALLRKWDPWIDKLILADLVVFTTPLWSFHAPIHLKAFIDIVTQHGKSYHYSHEGPTGVLDGKRAVLFQTRGAWGPDHLGLWLKDCLWQLGGAGLDVVKADKQDLGSPEEREMEMARAAESARALAKKVARDLLALDTD